MHSRVVRRLVSWIALLAIVAVTFMPTVTRAFSGIDLGSVCSAESPRSGQAPDGHSNLDHCPYCALHADLALPTEPRTVEPWVVAAFRELPQAFLQAPRATTVWSSAQSRAPPSFA
jgi:hypothetical protein